MRRAGQLAHRALDLAAELIRPGVTTEEMDRELHRALEPKLLSSFTPKPS